MPHPVPNFLVAGAAKSGTTSLCHYLRQHPNVFVAREKESHHFLFSAGSPTFTGPGDDREFNPLVIPDRSRYLACFDDVTTESAVGEASVYYLYRPDSMRRALEFNPDMRFIVSLREPIARAFSAFSHQRRDMWESIDDFATAIAAEQERIAAGWSFGWHYRAVSDYVPLLAAVNEVVPPKQLHVLLYDDLVAHPDAAMQSIFSFLGVDDSFRCDTSLQLNMSGRPRFHRLNFLLARNNAAKDLVKRVVPYQWGVGIQQRVRNWNLRPEQLDLAEWRRIESAFRFDTSMIGRLSGRDVSGWLKDRAAS
ncbi:MAG: sulfotransferase [Pseudonocardiales bacterium]